MKYKYIVNYEAVETNTNANKETCHNGGGYSQPEWTINLADGRKLVVCDESCGDFGTRLWAVLKAQDGRELASAQWGTMFPPEEKYSSFEIEEYLFDVEDLTGRHILSREEVEW